MADTNKGSTGHRWTGKRWSSDTEIAFLLALKLTGNVTAACKEIGRSHHGADLRRKRVPEFGAKWQAILDEKHWETIAAAKAKLAVIDPADLARDDGAVTNRVRYDGWTPLRQRAFLRALAETGKIEKACKLVGISAVAARAMRKKQPSFAAAWDRALAKAAPTLEQIAVERAVNGVSEAVWHGGKVVGHKRKFSDTLMRDAVKREADRIGAHKTKGDRVKEAHAAAKAAGGFFATRPSVEKNNASIVTKLDAMERQLRRTERAAQLEWAARMEVAGMAP